ncbi:hypothetical protein BDD43_2395 [Mucilaginibacter gracilis]|uniref:Uncharacterized protein n=1 Tax=Mucilaginibacter gracilis TaxID=423350 RepID=A0A495J1N3_9SPHI|nr:hypothetical protein [Mucilaginibacter gracilis]RKR82224.1 hypothetical protein BDD43_2395 [Mucilaginibacter gracilis]
MEFACFLFGLMSMQVFHFLGMFYEKKKAPLNNPKYFSAIWIITIALALIGLSTFFYKNHGPNFYLFLANPLYAYITYRVMSVWFIKKMHRYPVFAAKTTDPKLFWDRVFGFCFSFAAFVLPIVILVVLYPKPA